MSPSNEDRRVDLRNMATDWMAGATTPWIFCACFQNSLSLMPTRFSFPQTDFRFLWKEAQCSAVKHKTSRPGWATKGFLALGWQVRDFLFKQWTGLCHAACPLAEPRKHSHDSFNLQADFPWTFMLDQFFPGVRTFTMLLATCTSLSAQWWHNLGMQKKTQVG